MLFSCSSAGNESARTDATSDSPVDVPEFSSDSAFMYLKAQCDFGPRVPNSRAHSQCGEYLSSTLRRFGAEVTEQNVDLTAFDGTVLHARNIIAEFNPDASPRILLLAHWDTRPWADSDSDPANHSKPVMGANDGASGVAVLLEVARQISKKNPGRGIDILFVDAEDWGSNDVEGSWALGARYFASNPHKKGYAPAEAILLDMVGGKHAVFRKEYFSMQSAPQLVNKLWGCAEDSGYADRFINEMGGAVVDDHVEMINAGIPAIDIIESCHTQTGFNPTWHTVNDTPDAIDRSTLKAVGQTVLRYIYK